MRPRLSKIDGQAILRIATSVIINASRIGTPRNECIGGETDRDNAADAGQRREQVADRVGLERKQILQAKGDETVAKDVAAEVLDLTRRYPVPGITPERIGSA